MRSCTATLTLLAVCVAGHLPAASSCSPGDRGDADAAGADGADLGDTSAADADGDEPFVPVPDDLLPHPEWECALDPNATPQTCRIECDTYAHPDGRSCPPGWYCGPARICLLPKPPRGPCVSTRCPDLATCDGPAAGAVGLTSARDEISVCEPRWCASTESWICQNSAFAAITKVSNTVGVIRDQTIWATFWERLQSCANAPTCRIEDTTRPEVDFDRTIVVVVVHAWFRGVFENPDTGEAGVVWDMFDHCDDAYNAPVSVHFVRRPSSAESLRDCEMLH